MRVAFFGLPLAAWLLHRDGHDVVYAGLSRDMPGKRRVSRTLPRVVMRPDVTSRAVVDEVRARAPELLVSWFWTTKLPRALIDCAPRAFGVHPSLLPRHRGPDPYFWAIDAGDAETGVTAHRLEAEYDTGAILGQRAIAIDPAWNAWQLARALDRPSLALLRDVAREWPAREASQDEARATDAPVPSDEELEIDWTWDTARLLRRVRAAAPAPGAWSFFGDEPIAIVRAAKAERFPRALAPGEAAVVDGVAIVRTGDGAIALLEGRADAAEGEEPYELDAADLADLVQAIRAENTSDD